MMLSADLRYLRRLYIRDNPIGNKGVKWICRSKSPLQKLYLYNTQATADCLSYLSRLPNRTDMILYLSLPTFREQTKRKLQTLSFKYLFFSCPCTIYLEDPNPAMKSKHFWTTYERRKHYLRGGFSWEKLEHLIRNRKIRQMKRALMRVNLKKE